MKVVHTKSDLRAARALLPANTGFVPTMGALHAGHMALVQAARAASDAVVVSIFVNPTQFGNPEDLAKYPDTLSEDLAQLEAAGVDLVFCPTAAQMYPEGADTIVETPKLADMLMGALRPGHFRGVATVVTKLFNLVQPARAWFGQKDYQQVLVIRQMVRDLEIPVEIVAHETVREPDGLAMSSRNLRLDAQDRAASIVLSQALNAAQTMAAQGATPSQIVEKVSAQITAEPRATLQSVDIRAAAYLSELPNVPLASHAVLLLAADFGPVLLIDNAILTP